MKKITLERTIVFVISMLLSEGIIAQEKGIAALDFLIGRWETREENTEKEWWETSSREIAYTLNGTYLKLTANAINSNGREREYHWYIHYNEKTKQFEMVSMFSNWYKTQFDILDWDAENRRLTIRSKPNGEEEFHERFGEIIFTEDFDEYTWKGENKYGDPDDPSIWKYIETGFRKR